MSAVPVSSEEYIEILKDPARWSNYEDPEYRLIAEAGEGGEPWVLDVLLKVVSTHSEQRELMSTLAADFLSDLLVALDERAVALEKFVSVAAESASWRLVLRKSMADYSRLRSASGRRLGALVDEA
jgi:hypothetical protein